MSEPRVTVFFSSIGEEANYKKVYAGNGTRSDLFSYFVFRIFNSVRLFCARPESVAFELTGWASP